MASMDMKNTGKSDIASNVTATRSFDRRSKFVAVSAPGSPALNPPHDPGASEPKDFAEIRRKGKTEERRGFSPEHRSRSASCYLKNRVFYGRFEPRTTP